MRILKSVSFALSFALTMLGSAGIPLLSAESNYPTRPIRWIVAWPPGGSTDVIARIVAQSVSAGLHKTVFIDNRGGAAGVIGMKSAVAAKPDGYTFLVSDSGISSVASLYGSLPFDPDKDLLPITMFARVPHLIVVKNDLPVKSISELVSLAKSNPDSINFGSAGSGSPLHLAGELFRVRAGITWQHVPYRGAGPTIAALLAGEVDVASPTLANVISQINAGKVRALAVMSQTRTPLAPNIPTLSEVGFSDAEAFAYYGLSAPVGVAPGILKQTYEACIQALRSPDVIANLKKQGAEPVGNTPGEYGEFIRADMAKWEAVVRAANIPKQDLN